MTTHENDDDVLVFLDDDDLPASKHADENFWNILIVDDDEEIHSVTRLALSNVDVAGRPLRFLHAYSAHEALEFLQEYGNSLAIILLDVVMETDDAGLTLVRTMRREMRLEEPRIILRTGQPGYAPEESVIKDYDINDYKTKTELTRGRLLTTVIASIRSYRQIVTINQNRRGLRKVIESAANLLEEHSVRDYCEGVVTQISSLIGLDAAGLVCARAYSLLDRDDNGVYVLGAAGEYAQYINQRLEVMHDSVIIHNVIQCLLQKEHIFQPSFTVLYMSAAGHEAAVFIRSGHGIENVEKDLLQVFLSSVAVGYENARLFHELKLAAYRDSLTKLPNRNEFINMLDAMRDTSQSGENRVAALIDLSHFADINDGLGQEVGNQLLIAVATRLLSRLPPSVGKGRIGADVFGLIGLDQDVNPSVINDLFKVAFEAGDQLIQVNAAIGLTRVRDDQADGLTLIKQANIALNRAKKSASSNFEYYAADMEQHTYERLAMMRKLRTDFTARKLELWFQPQISLKDESVIGMEALLRWPEGNGNYISPAVFIPLAEYTGLIVDIGYWVLEEACRRLVELNKKGYEGLRMAVNISVPQFRDPDFVPLVKHIISQHGVEPAQLELEITESVAMDEPKIVVDSLTTLKNFGIRIAIDDFGTGFSSMSYLQSLPLDRLKVDRAFLKDVGHVKSSAFIADTIVTLAKRLGLETIAEGVENPEQVHYIRDLGCDEAQGFLYAKPMPFDQLLDYIANYQPLNIT
ncbi:EAL domain-containing protein [Pseudobowmanella zhangzhouensis]|uniref:EAL domain-containing protein n=1 Tax=Pseudobowmanella zhangzhouensis TaxID=1537679 RepID=UPI00361453A0